MVSNWLIVALCVFTGAIALVCLLEGRWPASLYFACATGIQLAILWGLK